MAEKPNILIALTAYRERPTGGAMKSVMRLTAALTERRITNAFTVVNHTDIGWVRNTTASAMLASPHTHLAFVDDDMAFNPSAFLRMLEADKPLISCVCPNRFMDLNKALDLARAGYTNGQATALATGFPTKVAPEFAHLPMAPVAQVGMAVTLIKKEVFAKMIEVKCVNEYRLEGQAIAKFTGTVYGFFDRFPGVGEDHSFCQRWREKCGGEIFAITDEEIAHIGEFYFRAKLSDTIKPASKLQNQG